MSIKKLCIRNIAMHMLMHMYLNINESKPPYRYIILICTNYIYFKIGFLSVSFLPDLPFYLFIAWKTSPPKYLVCGHSFF